MNADFGRATEFPRIVWMYWEQGWDVAPELVQQCRRSWEHHNPDWDIRCLDGATVREYFDIDEWMPGSAGRPRWCWRLARKWYDAYHSSRPSRLHRRMIKKKRIYIQGRSDILRLALLARYGGVWADATLWCHRRLSDWLWPYLNTGYFSYQNREVRSKSGELLRFVSWFLAARSNHYLIGRMHDAALSYWARHARNDQYFWLHDLVNRLYGDDTDFRAQWDAMPQVVVRLGEPGPRYFSPFTDAHLTGVTDDYKALIDAGSTPMFKLRHRRVKPLEEYDRIRYLFATLPRGGA